MLISPTEKGFISKGFGTVSSSPEKYGSDALWVSKLGLVGVQRKEVKDFAASDNDGRLDKELIQMQALGLGVVIIEGDWQWTTSGESLKVPGYTKRRFRGRLFSMGYRGYLTIYSQSLTDTIESISQLQTWSCKDDHGMVRRPSPKNSWGTLEDKDFRLWFWQSFEGIGPRQATNIDDYFNGCIPLQWTCVPEELLEIKGIGVKRAKTMLGMFGNG